MPEQRQQWYGSVRFGEAFCDEAIRDVTALILTEQAVAIGTNTTVQSKETEEGCIMDDQGKKWLLQMAGGWTHSYNGWLNIILYALVV